MLLSSMMERMSQTVAAPRPVQVPPKPAATVSPPVDNRAGPQSIETNFVSDRISKNDYEVQKKRLTTDYIHVSSLRDVCPRQYALLAKMGEYNHEKVNTNDRIVWAIGRAIENHLRDSFIESMNYEGIYGGWRCRCHKVYYSGFLNREAHCATCDTPANRYVELPMFDEENKIVGNPDIQFVYNEKFYPVEIKSVKGGESKNNKYKGFKDLDSPLGDHVFQAQMYRYLMQKNGLNAADEVIILYGSKDYSFRDSPLKEFHVDVSGREYEAITAQAVGNAKAIFDYLSDQGPLPERVVCKAMTDVKAGSCPVAGRCFM